MSADGAGPRLTAWLAEQRPDISGLRIEGLGRVEFGHSAEMLEPPVRAPRALWIEESGEVLGRPLYVMERAEGQVYERELPPELKEAPERVARMSARIFDQIAAMHTVDLAATGLHLIGDGRGYVDDELTAVFDWELATIGDPMADIGWAEMTWRITPAFAALPLGHFDEQLARYAELTGFEIHDRQWYAAFQAFKVSVIQLVGAMLFDRGHSDDIRYAHMAMGVQWLTQLGLASLAITEEFEAGPVAPRPERVQEVRARA